MQVSAGDWRSRILSIDGNRAALEQLEEIVRSGGGSAFVGAGASAGLYPLWGDLYRIMAEEAEARRLAGTGERRRWDASFRGAPQTVLEELRNLLGEAGYRSVLRFAFRPKAGFDGNRFSPVHGLIAELRFRRVITTNYDPGLLEARRQMGYPDTGYATWLDDDALAGWRDGQGAPILFAHGIYERPDTVVLTTSEYQRAYEQGPYRQLLETLVTEDRIVFVGASLTDPWFEQVVSAAVRKARKQGTRPRHIALLPLRSAAGGLAGGAGALERYRELYDTEPLFYPVRARSGPGEEAEDHSDLLLALRSAISLVGARGVTAAAHGVPAAADREGSIPERGTAEAFEQETFAGRADALEWLDGVAADPEVRAAVVIGLGGIGKTALVWHWVRKRRGHLARPCAGIVFWSFNERQNTAGLLQTIVELAGEAGWAASGTSRVDAAAQAAVNLPLLIVLDGVERLQSTAETSAAGALLDEDLRLLVLAVARPGGRSLLVATSREPLTDIEPLLGRSAREKELTDLPDAEGALLLELAGVPGAKEERAAISRELRGNPLGLRIFADAYARAGAPGAGELMASIAAEAPAGAPQLGPLLEYYEGTLSRAERAILSGVALLETAPMSMLLKLVRGVAATRPLVEGRTDAEMQTEVESLARRQIVALSPGGYGGPRVSCHPILREHFRAWLLGEKGAPVEAVTALGMRPQDFFIMFDDQRSACLALIDGLIASGDMGHSDALYAARFAERMQEEPALHLRTMMAFVATEERRSACAAQLGPGRAGFFLDGVVVLALTAGRLATARRFGEYLAALIGDGAERAGIAQGNRALVALHSGELAEAAELAGRAAEQQEKDRDLQNVCLNLSVQGYALALAGRLPEARKAFDMAQERWARFMPHDPRWGPGVLGYGLKGESVDGYGGSIRGETHWRCGEADRARELLEENLRVCGDNEWVLEGARCAWRVARLDCEAGRYEAAEEAIKRAAAEMRQVSAGLELGWALLELGEVRRRRQEWDGALAAVGEAVLAMGGRSKPLQYADALVKRGRILLERSSPAGDRFDTARAAAHAADALVLARRHRYVWAELDALRLIADCGGGTRGEAEELEARLASLW